MFRQDDMRVFDWIAYWIVMAIPLVNIIVLLYLMFSQGANPSLKSMLWANVVIILLCVGLILGLAYFTFGGFDDLLNSFGDLIDTIIDIFSNLL